jgi:hypothetical protein
MGSEAETRGCPWLCENALFQRNSRMIPKLIRGDRIKRFVEGADRNQSTLLPEYLEDWIGSRRRHVFVCKADSVCCRTLPAGCFHTAKAHMQSCARVAAITWT